MNFVYPPAEVPMYTNASPGPTSPHKIRVRAGLAVIPLGEQLETQDHQQDIAIAEYEDDTMSLRFWQIVTAGAWVG